MCYNARVLQWYYSAWNGVEVLLEHESARNKCLYSILKPLNAVKTSWNQYMLQLVKWALIPNVCSRFSLWLPGWRNTKKYKYWDTGWVCFLTSVLRIEIGCRGSKQMSRNTTRTYWWSSCSHLEPIHPCTSCSLFIVSCALVVKPKPFEDNAAHCLEN